MRLSLIHTEIKVPAQLFIHAYQNKYSKDLRFYILLKLNFPQGKFENLKEILENLQTQDQIKSHKTVKKHLEKLIQLRFITFNKKTNYYQLISFDKIRVNLGIISRKAIRVDKSIYKEIYALTGAVIFAWLHRDFWRNVHKEKVVTVKGVTYNSKSFKTSQKKSPAPVSLYGVNSIYGIPVTSIARLKKSAIKHNLIDAKHTYSDFSIDKLTFEKNASYYLSKKNIVFRKGEYFLQGIDHITPNIFFYKRKKVAP